MKIPIIPIVIIILSCVTACGNAASTRDTPMFEGKLGTELAEAIKNDNITKMQRLIRNGAEVNAIGSKHRTLLFWALFQNKPNAFDLLLDQGADPTIRTTGGTTIMHTAAMLPHHPEFLKMLIHHGAPIDIEDDSNQTPLFSALSNATHRQVDLLLRSDANVNHKAKFGNTPLLAAASTGDTLDVFKLLKAGANPKAKNKQGATFQTYLSRTDDSLYTNAGRKKRQKIRDYLKAHRVEVKF